jgi:uncharacterized membrane-anchored protein
MDKQKFFIGINALAIVSIVYLDMALWTAFGPSSMFQQFPIIFLTIIPIVLIILSIFLKKLPKV